MRYKYDALRGVLLTSATFCFLACDLYASDWFADPAGLAPVPDPFSPAPPPELVTGKEYSADEVGTAGAGFAIDHDADGNWDHFQNVLWDANLPTPPPFAAPGSGSADGLDYNAGVAFIPGTGNTAPPHTDCDTLGCDWVDAIANRKDALFFDVIDFDPTPDKGDASHLLFSVSGDPALPGGPKVSIYSQETDALSPAGAAPGAISVWATTPRLNHHAVTPFPAPPVMPPPFGEIDDIDGLEIYNNEESIEGPPIAGGPPMPPPAPGSGASDSDRFSLDFDVSEGVSIWSHDVVTATNVPYLEHEDLAAAVITLFGSVMVDIMDAEQQIDLDALMVFDEQTTRNPDTDMLDPFDPEMDSIIFSIDPIPGTPVTGGELMVIGMAAGPLSTAVGFGLPSSGGALGSDVAFLEHGGMIWDTPGSMSALADLGSGDIDAIESVSSRMIPEPSTLVVMGIALSMLGLFRGRHQD